jgi:hypothetical protein
MTTPIEGTTRQLDFGDELTHLRDHGYQPSYNGRPSCPFCANFIDDEETHAAGCPLVRAVNDYDRLRAIEDAAKALSLRLDWFLHNNIYFAYPFEDEARALREVLR